MSQNFTQSVYREHLLEHLLVGELMRYAWLHRAAELEVSRPLVDRAGHDVVLEANGITRHVQLKTSTVDGATRKQAIHLHLGEKPSGCVIWSRFEPSSMLLDHFLFFGGLPGEPLPDLTGFEPARHTRADSLGVKKERPNLRALPASAFDRIDGIAQLYQVLFGPPYSSQS